MRRIEVWAFWVLILVGRATKTPAAPTFMQLQQIVESIDARHIRPFVSLRVLIMVLILPFGQPEQHALRVSSMVPGQTMSPAQRTSFLV
jgi:hypothetical protein